MQVERRYHFHRPGAVFAVVTLLLGIGAINSQNNLLFLLFGLGVGAYVVSGFASGWMMMRIRAKRVGRSSATAGGSVRIGYQVRYTGRWLGAFALSITELEDRIPGERREGNWRGRIEPVRAFVAHAPASRAVRVTGSADANKRGICHLSAIRIESRFPFGLMRKSVTIRQPGRVIVRPRVVRLMPGLVEGCTGRDRVSSGSGRKPQRVGEFFGLREYVPGDSPRTIAWRASARSDKLVVRESADPIRDGVWIVLELGHIANESDAQDAERAISLAASLLAQGDEQNIDVGLHIPDHSVAFPPAGGRGHIEGMLDALGELDIEEPPARMTAALGPGAHDIVIVVRAGESHGAIESTARLILRGEDIDRLSVGPGGDA